MGYNHLTHYSVESYPLTKEIYTKISRDTLRALIDQVSDYPTNKYGFKTTTSGMNNPSAFKQDLPSLVQPLLGNETYIKNLMGENSFSLIPVNRDHEAILDYYKKIIASDIIRSLAENTPERQIRFAPLTKDLARQRESAAIVAFSRMISKGDLAASELPLGLLQDLSRGIRKRIEDTPQLVSLLPDLSDVLSTRTQSLKPFWYQNPGHPKGQVVAGLIRSVSDGNLNGFKIGEDSKSRLLDFGRKTGVLEAGLPKDVYATVQQTLTSLMRTRQNGDVESQKTRLENSREFFKLGRSAGHFDMKTPSDSTELKLTTSIREVMTDIQKRYAELNDKEAVAIVGTALWAFKKGIDKAADDVIEGEGDMVANRLIPPAWLQKRWNSVGSFDEAVTRQLRHLSQSAKTILGVLARETSSPARSKGQERDVKPKLSHEPSVRATSAPGL